MILDSCVFCKIINRSIPADIVFEDDYTLAFRDINPQAPTHILVIPKTHISGLNELNEKNSNIILHITQTAKKLTEQEEISKSGYRWVINSGKDGGQTVFHLHLHVLGGRNLDWPPG